MTDRHIDYDEAQTYGTYAADRIQKRVVGLIPDFDGALGHCSALLLETTAAVKAATARGRDADSRRRGDAPAKGSLLGEGIDLLGRFSRHLDAQPQGSVDRKRFFVHDGTASGVGRSGPKVLLALHHIHDELTQGAPVAGAADWAAQMQTAADALAPVIDHADTARADRRQATPATVRAFQAWQTAYRAAKSQVETVLRLSGRLGDMSSVFLDLTVHEATHAASEPTTP